jgi:hypothetical protein
MQEDLTKYRNYYKQRHSAHVLDWDHALMIGDDNDDGAVQCRVEGAVCQLVSSCGLCELA